MDHLADCAQRIQNARDEMRAAMKDADVERQRGLHIQCALALDKIYECQAALTLLVGVDQ